MCYLSHSQNEKILLALVWQLMRVYLVRKSQQQQKDMGLASPKVGGHVGCWSFL